MTLRQSAAPVRIGHVLLSISPETPLPATPTPAESVSVSGSESARANSTDASPSFPATSAVGHEYPSNHPVSESQSPPTEAESRATAPVDVHDDVTAQAAPWSARASLEASVDFVAVDATWPADKSGVAGRLLPSSSDVICDESADAGQQSSGHVPGVRLRGGGVEMEMELDYTGRDPKYPQQVRRRCTPS